MSSISEYLATIKKELPTSCTLVAVSKTKPKEAILEAYDAGQRDFGENKVQELTAKAEALPKDIHWHMIGHLQRNKVKYIAPFVYLIHGVDSERLLREINKQATRFGRKINCLLQVFIATEETKFGFSSEEVKKIMHGKLLDDLPNVNIQGLMGMASNTSDQNNIQKEFMLLKRLYDEYSEASNFLFLSMGMSNDYQIAIEQGSNMIRIGSAIFGTRNYP